MLDEWDCDTEFLRGCLQKARGFATKDKEFVYLTRIPLASVDWWCERTKQWRNVLETYAWRPKATSPAELPAASSQEVHSRGFQVWVHYVIM